MPFVVCTSIAVLLSGAAELIALALYLSQPHPVALYRHKRKVSTRINECIAEEEVAGSAQGRTGGLPLHSTFHTFSTKSASPPSLFIYLHG